MGKILNQGDRLGFGAGRAIDRWGGSAARRAVRTDRCYSPGTAATSAWPQNLNSSKRTEYRFTSPLPRHCSAHRADSPPLDLIRTMFRRPAYYYTVVFLWASFASVGSCVREAASVGGRRAGGGAATN